MELYYINNAGQRLDFNKWPYLIKEHDLLDSGWSYTMQSDVVNGFSKAPVEKSMMLNIYADTKEEYYAAVNHFFETTEKDIAINQPGKLFFGNQYLLCNVIGSQKMDWSLGIDYMQNAISIITRNPFWISEQKYSFQKGMRSTRSAQANLDFPFDFPFDFSFDGTKSYIENDHYDSAEFELVIYGPCSNPNIVIAGHEYEVITDIGVGEYLKIISEYNKRCVVQVGVNGQSADKFNNRNKDSELFQRVPSGTNTVTWDGSFGFDITLYKERGEPKWTL